MKVLWVQWGLTEFDVINMAPSLLYSFGNGQSNATMGTDMGTIVSGNETIEMGPKLMRGSWNAEAWGSLLPLQQEGIANGTDFYFNKSEFFFFCW
jgi:hypothetical protein